MKRFLVLFLLFIMLISVVEVDGVRSALKERHDQLSGIESVPEVVREGLANGKNWFDITENEDGSVTIKYLGELNEDGDVAEGNAGIELPTRKDSDGNPISKMPLLKGSELTYSGGDLVKANILTPKECTTDGKGACPLDHLKGEGYQLGDYEYPVSPGSRIEYEIIDDDGVETEKIKITVPSEGNVIAPKRIDPNRPLDVSYRPQIEYKLEDIGDGNSFTIDSYMLLPGDNKISALGKFDFSVHYDPSREAFFLDSAARIENFNINSLRSDQVYLYTGGVPPPNPGDNYLLMSEDLGLGMFSAEGSTGYSIEFQGFDSGSQSTAKYYGGVKLDKDESYVWYVHGSGKDPEGKAFKGPSSVVIDPTKGVGGKKVFVETRGSFSHVNGNQFVHLNGNEANKGPRTYLLDKEQVIKGSEGTTIERDFRKKQSTVTQIDFKDPDGKPIKYQIKEGGKTTDFELKYDIFVDDANHILFPSSEKSETLLADTRFYDLKDLDVKREAIQLLNEGKPVEEIFKGNDFVDRLEKAAADRAAKIAAEEKAKQDALQANLPTFLRGVAIEDGLVKGLDETAADRLTGQFVRKRHQGNSRVIAVVLNSQQCGNCVNWMNNLGNPGGNVYELVDNSIVKGRIAKDYGIDLSSIRGSPPATVFIDTQAKRIIGFEHSYTSQERFNSYFR